jgi:SAM-dependent methyltransferase
MRVRHTVAIIGIMCGVTCAQASNETAAADRLPQVTAPPTQKPSESPSRGPDVIYVPTPPAVVEGMLKLAKVTKNDVVYDLGCGDGRIVIAAAKDFGAEGVGIDIDPERIKEAKQNAAAAGVDGKVQFLQADLFTSDISKASVVTLYLLPSLNVKLMPKLKKELKPGTRIVSHSFDMMGQWAPDQEIDVDGRKVYFWTIKESDKGQ